MQLLNNIICGALQSFFVFAGKYILMTIKSVRTLYLHREFSHYMVKPMFFLNTYHHSVTLNTMPTYEIFSTNTVCVYWPTLWYCMSLTTLPQPLSLSLSYAALVLTTLLYPTPTNVLSYYTVVLYGVLCMTYPYILSYPIPSILPVTFPPA